MKRLVLILVFICACPQFSLQKEEKENTNSTLVGDMILERNQMKFLLSQNNSTFEELALENPFLLWPNNTVFYSFDESIMNEQLTMNVVLDAMQKIENVSCIRFKPKSSESIHHIIVKKGSICSSKIGYRPNSSNEPQPLFVNMDLCSQGSIVHELLHSLGFLHMHTSRRRDEFIRIEWDNIKEDAKINFKIFNTPFTTMLDTEYDYDSITHYSDHAFAKDRNAPTIIAIHPEKAKNIGQRKALSAGDILRLNRLYKCENQNMDVNFESLNLPSSIEMESKANLTVMDDDVEDMILTKEQINSLYSSNAIKRNGLASQFHRWPNAVVPFEIDITLGSGLVKNIFEAMNYIQNRSCIRFARKTPQNQNYVFITKGKSCSSEVGMRRSGRQLLSLNESLCPRGKIIHEMLHTLGFLHMHTANERDNFINVNWENIKEDAKINFQQFIAHVSMFNTPYDYNSIMHYSQKAFAKDKKIPTLIPTKVSSTLLIMGQREGMSLGDIVRLNRMYKCGPPYLSTMPENVKNSSNKVSSEKELKNELHSDPISKQKITATTTDSTKQIASNRTIFGVLIFKSILQ